jgi:O-antigen ligase
LQTGLHPAVAYGATLFALLWLLARLSVVRHGLESAMPMFGGLVSYLLAAWLSVRLAGRRILAIALLPALLVAVAANLYEFLVAPNTWSVSPGRAAGFFVNPNNSGAMIAGLFALWLALRERGSIFLTLPIALLVLPAIFVTFSRGSIVLFLTLTAIIVWRDLWLDRRRKITTIAVAVAVAVASGSLIGWLSEYDLTPDASMRLQSLLGGRFDDASAESRHDSMLDYLERFFASPVAGAGLFGSLMEVDGRGPHNAFVAAAADLGIVGLLAYAAIVAIGLRSIHRLRWKGPRAQMQLVIVVWLALFSLFSHNVFYSAEGAMMIGLLMGSIAARGEKAVQGQTAHGR